MVLLDVISPDSAFRHALREQFAADAWGGQKETPEFADLAEALGAWRQRPPGLIVMDAAALDCNAGRLARVLQETETPVVLFLVGETKEKLDGVTAAETFSQPVRLGRLLSRWQFYRHVRLKQHKATLALGPWLIVPRIREAQKISANEKVRLTDKEIGLLEYLYQAPASLPRETILEAVWGYDSDLDTHTLETHVTGLRRKLEPAGDKPEGSLFLVERGHYQLNPSWLKT
jgi:DNA-binding response OmpR family regulator